MQAVQLAALVSLCAVAALRLLEPVMDGDSEEMSPLTDEEARLLSNLHRTERKALMANLTVQRGVSQWAHFARRAKIDYSKYNTVTLSELKLDCDRTCCKCQLLLTGIKAEHFDFTAPTPYFGDAGNFHRDHTRFEFKKKRRSP